MPQPKKAAKAPVMDRIEFDVTKAEPIEFEEAAKKAQLTLADGSANDWGGRRNMRRNGLVAHAPAEERLVSLIHHLHPERKHDHPLARVR